MTIKIKKQYLKFLNKIIPNTNFTNSVELSKKSLKTISDFLSSTSFYIENWPYSEAESDILVQNNILYHNRRDSKFQLTFKGLIIVEYGIINISAEIDKLLNDFNRIYFENPLKTQNEPFTPRERVIILTILGLQAFSQDHLVMLKENNSQDFIEATDDAIIILSKIFPNEKEEFKKIWDSSAKSHDSFFAVIRKRLNELPIKTEGLFNRAPNKNGIFLDIFCQNGDIYPSNYVYLLKKILDGKYLTEELKKELIVTLNEIEKKSISIVESVQPFDKLKVNTQIKELIMYDY
jgi:hypothetical protein